MQIRNVSFKGVEYINNASIGTPTTEESDRLLASSLLGLKREDVSVNPKERAFLWQYHSPDETLIHLRTAGEENKKEIIASDYKGYNFIVKSIDKVTGNLYTNVVTGDMAKKVYEHIKEITEGIRLGIIPKTKV